MRDTFAELKKSAGIDPSTVEYLVIAVRFNKPAADLSFVAPDVMAVVGGDFSSESLMTLAQVYLQDKARVEKHGSKSITIMTARLRRGHGREDADARNHMPKSALCHSAQTPSQSEIVSYLKSAIDAADGNGRISAGDDRIVVARSECASLRFRHAARRVCKELWLGGTRKHVARFALRYAFWQLLRCRYNDRAQFHALRGAMNADNPDTAKIINNLFSGLMQQGISAVPDKEAQTILKSSENVGER